jgi:methylthioribulose 1-phosphate dehydratase/enolase-phosphatase E1
VQLGNTSRCRKRHARRCRNLYEQGAVSGTGGGISIKVPSGDYIVMAPSGVQKERMQPDDMFVLDPKGDIVFTPAAKPAPARPPKLSECSPLFMSVGGNPG